MIIYAQTNDHLYNMVDIEKFEKDGDTNIIFYFTNGRKTVESYEDTTTRDNVYNNLLTEFVKNVDA